MLERPDAGDAGMPGMLAKFVRMQKMLAGMRRFARCLQCLKRLPVRFTLAKRVPALQHQEHGRVSFDIVLFTGCLGVAVALGPA